MGLLLLEQDMLCKSGNPNEGLNTVYLQHLSTTLIDNSLTRTDKNIRGKND